MKLQPTGLVRKVRRFAGVWVACLLGAAAVVAWAPRLLAQSALEPSPQSVQEEEFQLKAEALPPSLAPVPGVDQNLGGNNNEPTLAIDPNNPMRLATATYLRLRVSTDAGVTFQAGVSPSVPVGFTNTSGGDSSLAYDSQGRLYWTFLLQRVTNRLFDVFIAQCDPTTGAIQPGYPVNISGQAGRSSVSNNNDKEWVAADSWASSPFRDRLYVVWSDLTNNVWAVWTSFSANQGVSWSTAVPLSAPTGEGFVWPSHNAVAPNGDVYVAYHSQPTFNPDGWNPTGTNGQIFVLRSTDGGATYPQKNTAYGPGQADITFNVQGAVGSVPGARFWWEGSVQPWVLADPHVAGRIYVFANDDPDNVHGSGQEANVYLVVSTNSGANWSAPVRIDGGPGNSFQVMPTAAIDPIKGCIAVQYYSNRRGATNAAGSFLLDVYGTVSTDGGSTWSAEARINDVPFDPDTNAPCRFGPTNTGCGNAGPNATSRTLRIGEYNGVAIGAGVVYAVWTGNDATWRQQTFFDSLIAPCPCDVVPPVVSNTVAVPLLWPPDSNLINVGLTATAVDQCDGVLPVIVRVYGDEDDETPTGDGMFSPDATDLASATLRLRSERKGDADGRVYLIVSYAVDSAGNVGFASSTVVVPHGLSKAAVNSVNAQALAAKTYCDTHGGTPPPGFVVVGDGPVIGPKQ